ncbi:hypothetical protein ACTVH1_09895 [Gluconobacter cerinus]
MIRDFPCQDKIPNLPDIEIKIGITERVASAVSSCNDIPVDMNIGAPGLKPAIRFSIARWKWSGSRSIDVMTIRIPPILPFTSSSE